METRFSPLTGNWVIRLNNNNIQKIHSHMEFQSPYGELGNTTIYDPA
ncbi:hypothetical protein HMPREF3201_01628 [Megasphaera sp. MJR8396C]|nr:hypothetical protein HMPREF3201_01628 [Megasphaera sp. MJR8396C]